LKTLFFTIVVFVSMDVACLFAWSGASMMAFRFLQALVRAARCRWQAPISTSSSVRRSGAASFFSTR
jgi:hypothetical protein